MLRERRREREREVEGEKDQVKEKGVSRTSISRTKEQEEQEKARTRIQCVLRGINELSRRRRREAGLPQLTAEPPRQRRGGRRGGRRAGDPHGKTGSGSGGDWLEFRVGRQRAAPPSFASPPNPPRPRPTLAGSLRFHPRSPLSPSPQPPRQDLHTHSFSLAQLVPKFARP